MTGPEAADIVRTKVADLQNANLSGEVVTYGPAIGCVRVYNGNNHPQNQVAVVDPLARTIELKGGRIVSF